ncbi:MULTISPECIES: polyprenyl synthetase family protein [unclassified Staphylococcus]|uniref:polyprenyl synthetase family protein n=1 Tax=unclassified Staphylococcus TaxID=91994 RepID=UPI0021CDF2FD|nr:MULTISPECIES: polyprenyl synthetase family protein [unclassified Staphylococcus]UXR79255.1 polyprenyl synthetase family protein [Staphylococcus sp. IVB6227]UXR83472.1 polyprenyl synthetase family protein [Staphylococcus sp. IVB6214]
MSKINLNQEIKTIEKRLQSLIKSDDPILESAANHLLKSGGKRVRPLFVILSSYAGSDQANESAYRVATALELIHMATLVHDDVIDYSDKRRGKKTIEKQWDKPTAILTGNFLLARALEYLSYIEDPRIHRTLSAAITEVCRGELFQFQDQFRSDQSMTNYLRRINRKTALLIQLSTEVGAMTSGADAQTVRTMRQIGHYIGMSFQIIDDILDFTSTTEKLGKPVGSDLRNGHLTLPVLLEMRRDQVFKQKVASLHPDADAELFEDCVAQIRRSDVIAQSKEISAQYLSKATQQLDLLSNDALKPLFQKIIHKLQHRMR